MAMIATPQIPQKVFRHFAIVTVALTALIALLADGESRQATADAVEQGVNAAEQQGAARRASKPQITRRDETGQNRFEGGDSDEFGTPMVRLAGSTHATSQNLNATSGTRNGQTITIPGYSQAYLDSLSEDEFRRLVQTLRAAGMLDPDDLQQSLAEIEGASRHRSGKATGMDALVN